MACWLRVLCVSTGGSSPCIVLSTETQRFLFDSGEGVQRLCIEHRVRLSKVDAIFLTLLSQDTVAGLPGLMLTCAESGRNGLKIVGPRGLQSFWNSTASFTYRPQFNLTLHEKLISYDVMEFDKVLIHCLALGPQHSHMCYIIETKVLPGKFDIESAKKLGVPVGPLLGKLQNGENVTLADGSIVTPGEVVAPSEKSRFSLIICNCISIDSSYSIVELLVDIPIWHRFFQSGDNSEQVECIIHSSPLEVTRSPQYSEWMRKFSSSTYHLMIGKGNCCPQTAFQAATIYTSKLNKLYPEVFAALRIGDGVFNLNFDVPNTVAAYPGLTYNIFPRRVRGIEVAQIDSLESVILEETAKFWDDLDQKSSTFSTCLSSSKDFKQKLLDQVLHSDPQRTLYPEENSIIFLGTGCAQPSKYRNVSGIYVQLDGGGMLLDCGEGTWQQLIRMVSSTPSMRVNFELSPEIWAATQLKLIWISHPHADHHLGVIRVISERRRLLSNNYIFEPLLLIAPESVLTFVRAFEEYDPLLSDSYLAIVRLFRCFDNFELKLRCNPCNDEDSSLAVLRYYGLRQSNVNHDDTPNPRKKRVFDTPELLAESLNQLSRSQPILSALGIDTFENLQVIHCSQSYAASIVSKRGWKLVYSGDTRPSARLVELGHGATVLIHEATFSDCKADEALKKRHSTISEAIEVAQQMNAQRLILTHFSQRYPSTPPLPVQCLEYENPSHVKVVLAYDFMRLTFQDCYWAYCMNSVLTLAFPPEEEEDKEDLDGEKVAVATTRNQKRGQSSKSATPRNSPTREVALAETPAASQPRKSKKLRSDCNDGGELI